MKAVVAAVILSGTAILKSHAQTNSINAFWHSVFILNGYLGFTVRTQEIAQTFFTNLR